MTASLKQTVLLTGATGLVGRYLMAGFLDRGCEVAVLARGNNLASAKQRVEQAAESMEQFYSLPRAKVLEGSLTSQGLGLSEKDRDWLQRRELVVVHCAASIKFHRDKSGEPYKTNLVGTENLLQFCRSQRVIQFHYVSTAYVGCRTRNDRVYEVPVQLEELQGDVTDADLQQNDYELSKIRSEAMIMQAGWLGRRVIHRPSIVVGDSRTAYTSTFHGFYAPLKIGMQYASAFGFSGEAGDWFRQQLGLSENDGKNLVPVDWVAHGIVKAVTSSDIPDSTILHWTNPAPVSCIDMQAAIVEAIQHACETSNQVAPAQGKEPAKLAVSANALPTASDFRSSLDAYASYFSSDPAFDNSNTQRYFSEIECPKMDLQVLEKMAEFALSVGFGWPLPQPVVLAESDIFDFFQALPESDAVGREPAKTIVLRTIGAGAMERMVLTERGSEWIRCINLPEGETVSLTLRFADLTRCIRGVTDITQLTRSGKALICAADQTVATNSIANLILYVKSSCGGQAH